MGPRKKKKKKTLTPLKFSRPAEKTVAYAVPSTMLQKRGEKEGENRLLSTLDWREDCRTSSYRNSKKGGGLFFRR